MSALRSELLQPILLAGYGRSGTTTIMKLLASDRQIAFDREYPYEIRYLSYYAKLSAILENRPPDSRFTDDHLYAFEESICGPWPWPGHNGGKGIEWLGTFWRIFSDNMRAANPMAHFYAEKAPVWLAPMVQRVFPCFVVHLFRDPRDVYISSNAFMRNRNYYGFHRTPGDTDLDHARNLAVQLLNYFENFIDNEAQKTNCFFLRYEDFAIHPEELISWLRSIGLSLELDAAPERIEGHQTSDNLFSSVGRWQKEYIPSNVYCFLERQLGREMRALGYPVGRSDFCPSIEFRTGAVFPEVFDAAHGSVEVTQSAMTVHIKGHDLGILLAIPPIHAEDVDEVWVLAAGNVGDHFSIYWPDLNSHFSEDRAVHVSYAPGLHWRIVRFQVRRHPLWKGTIRQLRLDLFNFSLNSTETRGVGQVRWMRLVS